MYMRTIPSGTMNGLSYATGIYRQEGQVCINLKCAPEWIEFWRKAYSGVRPGYHLNKKHWNTVVLDGSVPDEDIKRMIGESYDLTGDCSKKR